MVLLAELMTIELWGTVTWNENVGLWGQEEKKNGFLLPFCDLGISVYSVFKSCGRQEESIL